MNDEQILQAVRRLAREHLEETEVRDLGAIQPGTRLIEDLDLDSVEITTLAVELEDHFDVMLEDEDASGIVTVADLMGAIRRQLVARHDQ